MANVIEEHGQFWWFGEGGPTASLEDSVHGLLLISEEGQISLQLEGSLWFDDPNVSGGWDASRWLDAEKRITGRLGKDGDAGHVLLHELFRTDLYLAEKHSRQSYEAGFCFTNDSRFPEKFDLNSFHALRIELLGLEEWLRLESIGLGEEVRGANQVEFTVKYKIVEIGYDTARAKISIENLLLGISPFRFLDSLVSSVHIRQTNWLVYEPKEQLSLAGFQVSFRRIEEVIALLIGQYFSLDWPKLVAKFTEFEDWFTLYWNRGRRHEIAPLVYFMTTSFPLIRNDFGKMLDRWETDATKYGAACELFMASMRLPFPYPEHQFVNLIWAIESLHRAWQRVLGESPKVALRKKRIERILSRFSGEDDKKLHEWLEGKLKYAYESKLENRIVDSFQRLPFGFDSSKLRAFAERCARRRNDISHEGGSRSGEDAESFRAEVSRLAEAFRHLFHALLLQEIGLSNDLLFRAFTRDGIGSRSIVPALRAVGIELSVIPEE